MFHHLAIQTVDLDNAIRWYCAFFDGQIIWRLDRFSEFTTSRLPGITNLAEVKADTVRFHLFERPGRVEGRPHPDTSCFQHFCLAADSPAEVQMAHDRWHVLYRSGDFRFRSDEQPTPVIVEDDGVHCFYFLDVDGLEFELRYEPAA